MDKKFTCSGLPNYIEYYHCYDDLSNEYLIDGSELHNNKDSWNEKQKKKWSYFYRPLEHYVGTPQKKIIEKEKAETARTINNKKNDISQIESNLSFDLYKKNEAKSKLLKKIKFLSIAITILILLALSATLILPKREMFRLLEEILLNLSYEYIMKQASIIFLSYLPIIYFTLIPIILLPFTYLIVLLLSILKIKRLNRESTDLKVNAERRINSLDKKIKAYEERSNNKIIALEKEIKELMQQIPQGVNCAKKDEMHTWLKDELEELEKKCLGEILNITVTDDDYSCYEYKTEDEWSRDGKNKEVQTTNKPDNKLANSINNLLLYKQDNHAHSIGRGFCNLLYGPLIQENGLKSVIRTQKDKIFTFRHGLENKPLFRFLYVQYIYVMKEQLSTYSFYYDFVTEKKYGDKSETFPYNHITNISSKELEVLNAEHMSLLEKTVNRTEIIAKSDSNPSIQEYNGSKRNKPILIECFREYILQVFSFSVTSGRSFDCFIIDDVVVNTLNVWLKHSIENKDDSYESYDFLKKNINEIDKFENEDRDMRLKALKLQQVVRQRIEKN